MNRWQTSAAALALLAASACFANAAAAQTRLFREARRFNLAGGEGDATSNLALEDVGSPDGPPDGIADVVTVALGLSGGYSYVLFGAADGTFGTRVRTDLKTIPTSMAVDDFNGDGHKDLLVTDSTQAWFFRGGASGPPFVRQGEPTPAGESVAAVRSSDLNGDGNPDAVVVDEGLQSGAVKILLGNGDGTFLEFGAPHPTGGGSAAVALGRFNADSHTDLAVVNSADNTVSILFGDGRGDFQAGGNLTAGEQPSAIVANDVDGNGTVDLVVLNTTSDDVSVLDGRGDGSFAPQRRFGTGASGAFAVDLALGDVNGDGAADIVVANKRSCDVGVLLGNGKGSFTAARRFLSDKEPVAVTVMDVDGDELGDVVTVNAGQSPPTVGVLIARGDGSLAGIEDLDTLAVPTTVLASDVDNDGRSDLLLGHAPTAPGGDGPILVYRAAASPTFVQSASLDSGGDGSALGRGDLNGDGLLDLVAVSSTPAIVRVFPGTLGGSYGTSRTQALSAGGVAVAVGDFNRDGRDDVAVAERDTAGIEVLSSRADGTFGPPRNYAVAGEPDAIDSGDFNGDGYRDLAVASGATGKVYILLGSPTGSFTSGATVTAIVTSRWLTVADFDRDGNDDLAVGDFLQSRVVVYYGDGTGAFPAKSQSLSISGPPSALMSRDMTGDGLPDVLFVTSRDFSVSVYRNFGAARQFDGQSVAVSGFPTSVTGADFDADGRIDLATVSNQGGGAVSVATNIGAATVQASLRGSQAVPPGSTPLSAACGAAPSASKVEVFLALNTARLANATGAHVHVGRPGTNGPAIFNLFTAAAGGAALNSPLNKTLTAADLQPDAASGINSFADALAAIAAGRAYVDVHTAAKPDGEVRGRLVPIRRGDGNGDLRVSAADAVAVMREMRDGARQRAEDASRGSVESSAGIDSNGDGEVTPQDALVAAHWVFAER